MDFTVGSFYHLVYDHKGKLFDNYEHYYFFLNKYRVYVGDFSEVIAYCMLPDKFDFLIEIKDSNQDSMQQLQKLRNKIFMKYRKTLNINEIKSSELKSEFDIEKTINAIHFCPVKAGYTDKPEDWEFSSYLEYIEMREGTLPQTSELKSKYSDVKEIRYNTESLIDSSDLFY
jgi:REP element-mobilizing transposase RayT